MSMDTELDSIFKSTKSTVAAKPTTVASEDNHVFIERLQQAQKAATEHLEAQTFAGRELLKTKLKAERRLEQAKSKAIKETLQASKTETLPIDPEVNKKTLFVGNLSVVCIQKAEYKQLKSHFSRHGAIASIRFRSIAFKKALPRKIAFVSGNLHPDRDSLNAYIVYETEASVLSALAENGTVFMGKHLRVDTCDESKSHNKKKSVFVGNLPFNTEEEALWSLFESCGSIVNVRVIRDKTTNVGKGFAYIEFTDADSVTAALKMHGSLFNKRELRVFKYYGKASQEKDAKESTDPGRRVANMSKVHSSHQSTQTKRKYGPFKRGGQGGEEKDTMSKKRHASSTSATADSSPAPDSTQANEKGKEDRRRHHHHSMPRAPHRSKKEGAERASKPSKPKTPPNKDSRAAPLTDQTVKAPSKPMPAHDQKRKPFNSRVSSK